MATWTPQSKNTATITNQQMGSSSMTWNEANFTWDNAGGTWDEPHDSYANQTKNTAILTNQSKL